MIAPRCTAGWPAGDEVFAAFETFDVAFDEAFDVAFGAAFEAVAADFVGFVAVDDPVAERGAGGIVARLLAGTGEHTFCRRDVRRVTATC
jgi:hypothetical protein